MKPEKCKGGYEVIVKHCEGSTVIFRGVVNKSLLNRLMQVLKEQGANDSLEQKSE
jgi:hypothetical protein